MMKEMDIDKIIMLAEQKQKFMEQFLKLSQQQAEAIDQESYEMVLAITSQKQNIIEQVNLLNHDFPDQMLDNHDSLRIINLRTREIMLQTVALDNKNIQLLKNNQDEILQKLANIQKNKKTHAQYRGENMKMEGMLLDLKR